jgi:hypothetical protein
MRPWIAIGAAMLVAAWPARAAAVDGPRAEAAGKNSATHTRVVQEAVTHGATACADRFDPYVQYLAEDDDTYDHVETWSARRPNAAPFNAILADPSSEGDVIASATATPLAGGDCAISFVQVIPDLDVSCTTVREDTFKDWETRGTLSRTTVLEQKDDKRLDVMLTPLKNGGCLIVRALTGTE